MLLTSSGGDLSGLLPFWVLWRISKVTAYNKVVDSSL